MIQFGSGRAGTRTGTVESSFWKSSRATVWHLVTSRQDSRTTVLRMQCSRSSASLDRRVDK